MMKLIKIQIQLMKIQMKNVRKNIFLFLKIDRQSPVHKCKVLDPIINIQKLRIEFYRILTRGSFTRYIILHLILLGEGENQMRVWIRMKVRMRVGGFSSFLQQFAHLSY